MLCINKNEKRRSSHITICLIFYECWQRWVIHLYIENWKKFRNVTSSHQAYTSNSGKINFIALSLSLSHALNPSPSLFIDAVWSFTLSCDFSFHSIIFFGIVVLRCAHYCRFHFVRLCVFWVCVCECMCLMLNRCQFSFIVVCLFWICQRNSSFLKKVFPKKIDFVFHFVFNLPISFVFFFSLDIFFPFCWYFFSLCRTILYHCKMRDHATMDKQMSGDDR